MAKTNPSGAAFGGAAPGLLRAKSMRLLLNVSAYAPIRAVLSERAGSLSALAAVVAEQVAAACVAKFDAAAARSLAHGQDAIDTSLGLIMNLSLDDKCAAALLTHRILLPLADVLKTCPWPSCSARAAAAASRLLRFPAGAKQGREAGVLMGLLQVCVLMGLLQGMQGVDGSLAGIDCRC
jgi:hypothetical protein